MWGNEALPGPSPGKLTSLPLANSANTTHRAKRTSQHCRDCARQANEFAAQTRRPQTKRVGRKEECEGETIRVSTLT